MPMTEEVSVTNVILCKSLSRRREEFRLRPEWDWKDSRRGMDPLPPTEDRIEAST
jgi:hypothetical protein